MLEAARDPILNAIAYEAAGPGMAHRQTANPALAFVDQLPVDGGLTCRAA